MKHTFWPELEEIGEAQVRDLLLRDAYRGSQRFYAEEWLRHKEFSRFKEAMLLKEQRHVRIRGASSLLGIAAAAAMAAIGHLFFLT